jgi:hypothetical protein
MAQGNRGRLYRLGRELEKIEKLEKHCGPGFGLALFFSKPLSAAQRRTIAFRIAKTAT